MSFKEVNRLRKSGKLEDAAILSQADMTADPFDEWNKRGAVWVYYDYMKLAVVDNKISEFLVQLEKIEKLALPANEKIAFDAVAWSVGKLLFASKGLGVGVLNKIYTLIKNFNFSKPNDSYSFLLKAFKKHSVDWVDFYKFVNWWGIENFQKADYESFVMDDGRKIPSLVESVYIALSKYLLSQTDNKKQIEDFLPQIKNLSNTYKRMQYPPYYYGLLLLKTGDKEQFLKAFIPFVKRKQRDFWVWSHLAEAYEITTEEYFMCLCKSLSCGAPDKFTINVRKNLADVLVIRNLYTEAKYEYNKVIDTRKKEGWPLKDEHRNWINFSWWNTTTVPKNNNELYLKGDNYSQQLLNADVPVQIALVTNVNMDKKVFGFTVSKEISGFSVYAIFDFVPKQGDFVKLRLMPKEDSKSNFYKLYSLDKTIELPSNEIYKTINGKLVIHKTNSFGFVDNVFVSPQLISKYELANGQQISATAVQTYNPKRKAWGWNLINVVKS